jgi:hypothetical protein
VVELLRGEYPLDSGPEAPWVKVVETISPSTLDSGLMWASMSCSEPYPDRELREPVLDVDDGPELRGDVNIMDMWSRCHRFFSSTVRWIFSSVRSGESESRKPRTSGLACGSEEVDFSLSLAGPFRCEFNDGAMRGTLSLCPDKARFGIIWCLDMLDGDLGLA